MGRKQKNMQFSAHFPPIPPTADYNKWTNDPFRRLKYVKDLLGPIKTLRLSSYLARPFRPRLRLGGQCDRFENAQGSAPRPGTGENTPCTSDAKSLNLFDLNLTYG